MLPYEARQAHHWNDASLFFTDASLVASSVGAAAEITGFTLGSQAGPVGSVVGAIAGNQFHLAVTNPIEAYLSGAATLTTGIGDLLEGNTKVQVTERGLNITVGDATASAVVLQGTGGVTPVGVADTAVDAYAAAYSHGLDVAPGLPAQSIPRLFGWSGHTYSFGPLSINFKP